MADGLALEAGEPDRAVCVAQRVNPQRHPFATRRATYWVDYGWALARLRGRRDDAVRALHTAEGIFPRAGPPQPLRARRPW